MIEVRLTEIRESRNQFAESIDRLNADLSLLKQYGIGRTEDRKDPGSNLLIRKSLTRPESCQTKHRVKLASSIVQVSPIGDVTRPSDDIGALQSEFRMLRDFVERSQHRPRDPNIEQAFVQIHQRISECARKSDLNDLIECFLVSGPEGLSDCAAKKGIPPIGMQALKQPTLHVQMISGEALNRPSTHHAVRPLRSRSLFDS
jgi:HAMP domain-containing protein